MTKKTREPQADAFPWCDHHYLANGKPDALAVAARALALVDDLQATAREGGDENAWIVYGLSQVAVDLADAGNLDSLGVLLMGLETLIPIDRPDRGV